MSQGPESFPKYWDQWDYQSQPIYYKELKPSDDEFREIWTQFRESIHYFDDKRSTTFSVTPRVPKYNSAGPIKITRVQNFHLWTGYQSVRNLMLQRAKSRPNPDLVQGTGDPSSPDFVPPVLNQFRWAVAHPSTDSSLNEVRLWHGTDPKIAGLISENGTNPLTQGFDPRRAALEGRLGAAVYFADCPPKSFSYTLCTAPKCKTTGKHNVFNHHCEKPEHLADATKPRAIILARALLGRPKIVYDSMRKIRLAPDGYDSIIAPSRQSLMGIPADHRPNSTFWFSEYTVYEKNFCYPEYVIEWLPICTPFIDQDRALRLPMPSKVFTHFDPKDAAWYQSSLKTSAVPPEKYRFSQMVSLQSEADAKPKTAPKQPTASAPGPGYDTEGYIVNVPTGFDESFMQDSYDVEKLAIKLDPGVICRDLAKVEAVKALDSLLIMKDTPIMKALPEMAKSPEAFQYIAHLLAVQDQSDLGISLAKRWYLQSAAELIPVAKRPPKPGVLGAPIEDILRLARWERLEWWLIPAAVHFCDSGRDSFVDYREFEVFSAIFGPNFTSTINSVGSKEWFRLYDIDDNWLLGKKSGHFAMRLNSTKHTSLTLAIVKSPVCNDVKADLKKVRVEFDPNGSLCQIPQLLQAVGLTDLLEKIQGLDLPSANKLDLDRAAYLPFLLQNFRARVKVLMLLESKLDPAALEQHQDARLFFSSLRRLMTFLAPITPAPIQPADLPRLYQGLFDYILFPYLLQHELKIVLLSDPKGMAFAERLFGSSVPIHDRLGSHPLFRFLDQNPDTRATFTAIKHMRRVLVSSASLAAKTRSEDILSTIAKAKETVLELANVESGKFHTLRQSAYLQAKTEDLANALNDFEQNLSDSALRREVDIACYDLSEGFDALECIEQGVLQIPDVWKNALGPTVMEATQENIHKMLSNYFGSNFLIWNEVNLVLLRRGTVRGNKQAMSTSFDSRLATRKIPVTVFMALVSWIGGLPAGLPPPRRAQKLELLRELVTGDWFLGFVSRTFSSINLENYAAESPKPTPVFYGRVSAQNPNTITLDFLLPGETVKRSRIIPPGGLDPNETNWTLDREFGARWVDGAPSVVELVRKFRQHSNWNAGPVPQAVSSDEEWNHDSGASSEYINQGTKAPSAPAIGGNPLPSLVQQEFGSVQLVRKLEAARITDIISLCQAMPTDRALEAQGQKLFDKWPGNRTKNRDRLLHLLEEARAALAAMECCTECQPPAYFNNRTELTQHSAKAHPHSISIGDEYF